MMNGTRYWQLLDEKLEFFMHQSFSLGWSSLSQGQDCDQMVHSQAPHPAHQVAGQFSRPQPHKECMVMDETAAAKLQGHQHGGCKKDITELWVKKMADSDYLKKLVEGMPSRLNRSLKGMEPAPTIKGCMKPW
jgi:hypothetical protein